MFEALADGADSVRSFTKLASHVKTCWEPVHLVRLPSKALHDNGVLQTIYFKGLRFKVL